MAELKIYKSSSKATKLIVICSLFMAMGIYFIVEPEPGTSQYVMGWVGVCFFGIGIAVGIYQLFDRRAQIIITENGIWDRTTKENEIIWEQINDAYLLNINGQKFISLVVADDYPFKHQPKKWASKLNHIIGAQEININLSQTKIDETKLTELVLKLAKADKCERNNLIRFFNLSSSFNSNYLQYSLIVIVLLILSLSSFYAICTFAIVMGVAAVIAKWPLGSDTNSKLQKYAEKTATLCFITMILLFFTFKIYHHITDTIGIEITKEIENYKTQNGTYPKEIETINESLKFNFIQKYIADNIEYEVNANSYYLVLESLYNNQKEFDTEINEWN